MINIKEINTQISFNLDFVFLNFSILDTTEDITKYKFDLYRSQSETTGFKMIFSNIRDFKFKDYSVNLNDPEIKYYYKIKVTNLSDGEFLFSDIQQLPSVSPDKYASYLNYIYSIYLNTVIESRDIFVLKKIRSGEQCECFDDVYGSRKQDKCKICFGTGYVGGYYPPEKIKVNFANTQSITESMEITGTFEQRSSLQFWTLGIPIIQENDIIIDSLTKKRYVVKNWQPSYKDGFLLRQTVIADNLAEASILNKIPLGGDFLI